MNENIDLTKILKDCPEGFELYSSIHGIVTFYRINPELRYPICVLKNYNKKHNYSKSGLFLNEYRDAECCLFPSKDQRDWSKFKAPWLNKPKFDPKTLKPFDRILTMSKHVWVGRIVSHIEENMIFVTSGGFYDYCIPYNEETKYLIGTTEEAPEYYRYWEE